MTFIRKNALVSTLLLAGSLHAGSPAGVVVIANRSVRADQISAAALKNIYTGKTDYWDGGQNVVIVVLADKTDEALQAVSGMESSDFRTFWQRLVFSGRGQEPRSEPDAASLVRLVATTKGAIGLAPADARLNGVKTLEVK